MTAPRRSAIPFVLKRSEDVMGMTEIRSTAETIHGLLLLEEDRLVAQWRLHRATDLVGNEIRQDREVGPVREVEIPLDALAKVAVRKRWWQWRPRLVLTASDLRAFEPLAGQDALRTTHPGEIVLPLRRGDVLPAREFAADVALASAERLARPDREHLTEPHDPS